MQITLWEVSAEVYADARGNFRRRGPGLAFMNMSRP